MEKLSIEQKAKAYDEALEKAKYYHDRDNIQFLENIFPELKESEDEKVRKKVIDVLKLNVRGAESQMQASRGIDRTFEVHACNKVIAWLEKQGEQKPAKVETKFKVEKDKWYVCTQTFILRGKEVIIKGQAYQAEKDNVIKGEDGCCFIDRHDGKASDYLRFWTIADAKDGDVLAFNDGHGNDCIELIKSITDKKIEFWFCLTNGNRYEAFDGIVPYTNFASRKNATPATKEQCDLLFKKMHEAGYEWDAEKKELKKVEQKPHEDIVDEINRKAFPNHYGSAKVLDIEIPFCAKDSELEEVSYNIPNGFHAEIEDNKVVIKKGEQKPTNIVTILDDYFAKTSKEQQDKDWEELKHLNNFGWKLVEQKPAEWSEEDIEMIDWLIRCCEEEHKELCNDRYGHQEIVSDLKRDCRKKWDWLESLKNKVVPQTTWKPSKEQIMALRWVLNHIPYDSHKEEISGLLEQLKKLREE